MEDLRFTSFGSDDELNVFTASPLQPPAPATTNANYSNSDNRLPRQQQQRQQPNFDFSSDNNDDGGLADEIPESDIGDADTDQLLAPDETRKNASFWTFEYYQQFFDVDEKDVARRLLGSMLPRPGNNYLQTTIRPNPDLYGPLWVVVTLVFTIAICGNLSNFAASLWNEVYRYHFSFKKVTLAATVIFCYWWLLPTALRLVFWWRHSRSNITFLESICVYGYSLAVYIPISILWLIPSPAFRWLLVIAGTILSGSVLVLTFWPAVKDDDKKVAFSVVGAILLFHGLLALGFMLYFYVKVPPAVPGTITPTTKHNLTMADGSS